MAKTVLSYVKMAGGRLYITVTYKVHLGDCKGDRHRLCGFGFVMSALPFCGARVGFFYNSLIRVAAEGTINSDFL